MRLVLLLVVLSGCALDGVYELDEVGTYRAECNGGYNDFGSCVLQAQRKCGKGGYETLGQENNMLFARRSFTFRCNEKD